MVISLSSGSRDLLLLLLRRGQPCLHGGAGFYISRGPETLIGTGTLGPGKLAEVYDVEVIAATAGVRAAAAPWQQTASYSPRQLSQPPRYCVSARTTHCISLA